MSQSNQGGAGRREVAWRVFAAEYDDADFDYSESDEERAPNYVVTPTGARINRLFVVGVLTQVEQVSDDVLRGRVVDPTGGFVLYAGQYQPDEMAFLENADPPAFVAVTGKARTFQPEDSDRVFTSIRPESINSVDAETRDRWVVQTAEQTLSRVSTFADAIDSGTRGDTLRDALEASGVDSGLASGIPLALDHYGTTKAYLASVWDLAIDSASVVAGEHDADDVGQLALAPGEGDDEVDVSLDYALTEDVEALDASDEGVAEPEAGTAASEGPAEPETSESVPEAEETEADETGPTGEAGEPAATTASDDLGEVPTSTVEESEPEVETTADETEADASTESEATGETEAEAQTERTSEVEDATDEESGPDIGTAGAGDEMYEFDEEERQEVEEEYGLEFSSGSDVESPEESELEPPESQLESEPGDAEPIAEDVSSDADEAPESADTAATEASDASLAADEMAETEADEGVAEPEATGGAAESDETETPEDLEDVVMEEMSDLDEGDGVERETLMAAVVQAYDVTPADVDDALEAALMAGRCYESGEDTLKPI